jgi:radical SAM protein (TIGR04043 family)
VAVNKSDSITRKKAELQSRGVNIPEDLIPEMEAKSNAPAVRTGRIVLCLEYRGETLPAFIVNGKRAAQSPLHLVRDNSGRYEVWMNSEKYTDVTLLPHPRFYDVTAGGVPAAKLAVIVAPGHLRSVVNQRCYYHEVGRPCRFCAVQRWWDADIEKAPAAIAEITAAGVREGAVEHISLTTATLNTPAKGLETLVETARLIKAKAKKKVPAMLEFEPIGDFDLLDDLLREAKEAGVTTASVNIECFDETRRPRIMPIKGSIPVSAYQRTWERCLAVFGRNEVFTVAIAGLGEDDDSLLGGIEMAASRGVMTFLVPHSPAIGAAYEDMTAPGADRMLSLYAKAAAIYGKYKLDICASRAGCVHGGGFSAIKDVARFGV